MGRATKGGEIGMNGERYEGGQFLPNTTLPKQETKARTQGSRKVEIAPYVWEVPQDGQVSIYRQIAGIYGKIVGGTFVMSASDTTIAYYGKTRGEVERLINRWNAGERWV